MTTIHRRAKSSVGPGRRKRMTMIDRAPVRVGRATMMITRTTGRDGDGKKNAGSLRVMVPG
jgi:hypothetical protein